MMTPEETAYYEALMDLFTSKGWKIFIGQQEEAIRVLDASWATVKAPEVLYRNQGRREAHSLVVQFERMIREDMELAEKGDVDLV